MSNKDGAICVVLPYKTSYSETFLQAHIDGLRAVVIYSDRFPSQADLLEMVKSSLGSKVRRYAANVVKAVSVWKFFKLNNVKIVLAEYGPTASAVLDTCRRIGMPLVAHFHGYDAYARDILQAYGAAYRSLFSYSSAIIAVSQPMVEQLIKIGAPRDKVIHNSCGVDVGLFPKGGRARRPLQVLAVGRFVEKKAPYLTLIAFKEVLKLVPESRLVMVGDGPLLAICQNIALAMGIRGSVDFVGAVSHEAVSELMQESSVFVQHSIVSSSGDSEGTPVGILEAQAAGLPVVSTKHGGIIDAVIDQETGFLVEEGDVDRMASHICALLRDQRTAEAMGQCGRQHVVRNFALEASIMKLRSILAECAGR